MCVPAPVSAKSFSGEICWTVTAPTIVADGLAIWREGMLAGQEF
jgi:hypothetical protein